MSPAKPCDFPHVPTDARSEPTKVAAERESGDWTDEDMAEFAAKTFEPWNVDDCPLPTNQQWADGVRTHLFNLRLAFSACCKTKPELITMARDMERDGVLQPMMEAIRGTEQVMEGYSKLASAAWARLMNAALNVSEADVQGDRP